MISNDEPGILRRIACAGLVASASVGQAGAVVTVPSDQAEWSQLLLSVARHRISGLLTAAIESGQVRVTDAQYQDAIDAQRERMTACLLLEDHLIHISTTLVAAGIDVRALKGPAVAHLDYPDPSWRVFGDVDILVRSRDFDDAVDAITATGVERRFPELRPRFDCRFSKGVEFFAADRPEVDLHRTFVMGRFGLLIDLDEVWAGSEPFELAGHTMHALDADVRFLHACYHVALGGRHVRLAQLRDIGQLLHRPGTPIDIDRVLSLARSWKGEMVVARAVRLATDGLLLEENGLSRWATEFRPSSLDRRTLRTYLDPSAGYAARSLVAVAAIPGWRARLAFVHALAMPSAAYGPGRHSGRWQRWSGAAGDLRQILAPRPPRESHRD